MPKRGGGNFRADRNWNQQNGNLIRTVTFKDEHDDRDRDQKQKGGGTKRRVIFKPSSIGGRGGIKNRLSDASVKTRLEDDEEMVDFVGGMKNFRGGNNDKRNRRKGSPIPRNHIGRKKLVTGTSEWFLVSIPYGQKYEKDLIIRSLLNAISPEIFIPHYWRLEKDCVSFYLDDFKTAELILNVDRTIQMPDGFKMIIKVRNSIPTVHIDQGVKERMKLAMAKRYNPQTKALDLTKFHADVDLRDIFCGLFRPTIMLAAIDIIATNIPDLEALNLEENKIHLLDHFKGIGEKLPRLKILHMKNNKITSIGALEGLKTIPLVELVLQGNPIKDRYRDESVYVREVRKRFPKLLKLDGVDLPPQIGFDVSEEESLPPPKASFLCDMSGAAADIVRQFLQQYFIIFDSDNRQPLLDAYHEHAMLSLTVATAVQPNQRLPSYWPFNRNLHRHRDLETRIRQLRNGKLPVVSLLSELPQTQHDPQSFAVDLTLFTPQLISFTVTGVFKELSSKSSENQNSQLRSFQRMFLIVPYGGGFCIRNEMVHICNVTQEQLRSAFKPQIPELPPAPVLAPPSGSSSIQAVGHPGAAVTVPDEATKIRMVQAMAAQSNMNVDWSRKCLEETNWDFQNACSAFSKLHKENKIPPQAFIK